MTILSPEKLEARKRINKKTLGVFGVIFILFIIVLILLPNDQEQGPRIYFIPGLAPPDVHLNMKAQGFTTEEPNYSIRTENGLTWINKKSQAGIDYTVETFTYDVAEVNSVTATARIDVTTKRIEATAQFFQMVSTLPYDGAAPDVAASWVVRHFEGDHDTVISDVRFSLKSPSIATKILRIQSAEAPK